MKHILAAIATVLALGAMFIVYQSDKEVNKVEEISKMIAKTEVKVQLDTAPTAAQEAAVETMSKAEIEQEQAKKKKELDEKLQALKNKAVYKDLEEFKSGTRKNYVMYGLLSKMDESQMKELSDEIGSFEQKLKEQQQ